jgi:hypothetical protein
VAIKKFTDEDLLVAQSFLVNIAKNDKEEHVRKAAIVNIFSFDFALLNKRITFVTGI